VPRKAQICHCRLINENIKLDYNRILVQFPKQAGSHGVSFQLGASLFSSQKKTSQHPKKDFLREKIVKNGSPGLERAIFLFSAENVRGQLRQM
jgi:hypothetical protein